MVTFIKIEKDGKLYEEKLDNIENLYKKCGLRKIEGFINLYEYDSNEGKIELWGRNSGRSNIKNSYVFPLDINLVLCVPLMIICTSAKFSTVVYREIETVFGLERIPVLFVQIKSVQNDCYIYRYKVSSPLNILIFTIWNAAFTGAFKCSLIYTDILIYKQRLFVYVRMCLS